MFQLTGKVAVITGAGSGIGRAISSVFGRQGARVMALDVDLEAARETVRAIVADGGAADSRRCDVANPAQVTAVFEDIDRTAGRVDILVNNAGVAHVGTIERTTEEEFDRLYQVNVKGVFLCTKAALRSMVRDGSGVILNMASIVSLVGVPERFAYSMSKGAVHTMTMSVAVDYVKRNIRCNCICPARVHTPFVDQFVSKHYAGREEEMLRKLSEYQPMGRMATAAEVAWLALYLCSDEASFVTGQAYPIDGGVLNQ